MHSISMAARWIASHGHTSGVGVQLTSSAMRFRSLSRRRRALVFRRPPTMRLPPKLVPCRCRNPLLPRQRTAIPFRRAARQSQASSAIDPNDSGNPPSRCQVARSIQRQAPSSIVASLSSGSQDGTRMVERVKPAAQIDQGATVPFVLRQREQARARVAPGFRQQGMDCIGKQRRVIVQQQQELASGGLRHAVVGHAEPDIGGAGDNLHCGIAIAQQRHRVIGRCIVVHNDLDAARGHQRLRQDGVEAVGQKQCAVVVGDAYRYEQAGSARHGTAPGAGAAAASAAPGPGRFAASICLRSHWMPSVS
jgi:hypothetical protein